MYSCESDVKKEFDPNLTFVLSVKYSYDNDKYYLRCRNNVDLADKAPIISGLSINKSATVV
jgi:uncharacterized protein YkuJ